MLQNVCCISIYAPVAVPAPSPIIGLQPSLPPITYPSIGNLGLPPILNPIYPTGPYNQGMSEFLYCHGFIS